ncbi:GNAT family N-acetyltransferase, partial [Nitrososphaera sp.]|uniref:GNAT family N-acetyltransferase n=1 Tax=Nitrososphaera sp. TaxID=1971748 RepID=UPI002EDAA415
FIVKQHKRVLAFFTLSMSALESNRLEDGDKLENYIPIKYPAVLLGQMGVDKQFRGLGIGRLICNFCVGLAAIISERVACRYITLQTNPDKIKYYKEKCGFKQSVRANLEGKLWMYRKVIEV